MNGSYKRNYNPLIPLFYTKGLLDNQQLQEIPKRTLQHWNKNENRSYDFDHWVKPFTEQIEDIQKVYERNQLKKTMQFIIKISDGYHKVLSDVNNNNKLLKKNAECIVNSIDEIISETKIKVKRACKFYGVSSDWYYREKRKVNCSFNINPVLNKF